MTMLLMPRHATSVRRYTHIDFFEELESMCPTSFRMESVCAFRSDGLDVRLYVDDECVYLSVTSYGLSVMRVLPDVWNVQVMMDWVEHVSQQLGRWADRIAMGLF